jgi:Uma2 family endonuclease
MAENTIQYDLITMLKCGIDLLFAEDDNVFCAADLFWYPVQGQPNIRLAPDVLVVIGRPKGPRGSYKQWEEENIPLHVVIEIISPSNSATEMMNKLEFYDRHGVEEYYTFDPDKQKFNAWMRSSNATGDSHLQYLYEQEEWYSPRLGVTFSVETKKNSINYGLVIKRKDGSRFEAIAEIHRKWRADRNRADKERRRAEEQERRAEQEQQRAEQEKLRAEQEKLRAEQEKLRADALAEKLRTLGINPDDI